MLKINFPFKISLFYLIIGVAWILLSDKAILLCIDSDSAIQLTKFQNYKGVLFIMFTSLLLFFVSNYYYRKQERLVKQSEQNTERLNIMLGSITDVFFAVNKEWEITHVNDACSKLLNTAKKDLIGNDLWNFFPKNLNSKSYQHYNEAISNSSTITFEDYFNQINTWFQITAYPFQNGLAVYFRDITQQKDSQKEILLGKSNLDALINNTKDLIWSMDKEMKILSFNKPYADSALYFGGITLKKGDSAVFDIPDNPQLHNDWLGYYKRALQGERFSIEYFTEHKGQIYYSDTNFNPIYDENHELIGIGCFAHDITERKKNESEKGILIQRLINQNKGLEEFSFITSHNLRSPVASILGLIQIYNKENPSDELNKKIITNLEISALKLDEIIVDLTQILDTRHNINEIKENVNLESILETVKNMLAQQIEKNNASILTNFYVEETITVKSYMNNIFFNLISNAIKYRKEKEEPVVKITAEVSDGFLYIKFEDNGIGIDLEKHESKLFMPYKRFHDHVMGKGIGLYLVKSQVEALNGAIRAKSTPDLGTTFYVSLKL
ncbi:MAG TPA: PAS domain-containing sensor histidine kinase [Cytophagaceae bacterium]|nr:PAS domain-containing sensor histidine kinase [Cytophagaceae bacterium]